MRIQQSVDTWKIGVRLAFVVCLVAAVVFAMMRAIGTLGPINLRFILPISFVLMACSPWLLMTASGRKLIGLQRAQQAAPYLQAGLLGASAAFVCFLIGVALFGHSSDNWFVSIATNFRLSFKANLEVWQLFLVFTVPSIIFSPIGEEIFFRGILQKGLEERFSVRASTWIECVFFGLVHLCHHGLLFTATGISLLSHSAPIWFLLMVAVAHLFAHLRKRSASLYPAIIAHAAFNLVMGMCIFIWLWPVIQF
jgi:uncharacterized protein